jgi:hypothetical protein
MGTFFPLTGIFIPLANCIIDKVLPEANKEVFHYKRGL